MSKIIQIAIDSANNTFCLDDEGVLFILSSSQYGKSWLRIIGSPNNPNVSNSAQNTELKDELFTNLTDKETV